MVSKSKRSDEDVVEETNLQSDEPSLKKQKLEVAENDGNDVEGGEEDEQVIDPLFTDDAANNDTAAETPSNDTNIDNNDNEIEEEPEKAFTETETAEPSEQQPPENTEKNTEEPAIESEKETQMEDSTNKPTKIPVVTTNADVPLKNPLNSTDPETIAKIKRLNHKEVERRRRQTINNAIKELQDLVPTTHTNKSQIILKAADYIKKLKEKEEGLVNKWTLEKIITEQAISELANSNDKLKIELEKAYREIERRKNAFENFITMVSKQENSPEINKFLSSVESLFKEEEEEEEEGDEEIVEIENHDSAKNHTKNTEREPTELEKDLASEEGEQQQTIAAPPVLEEAEGEVNESTEKPTEELKESEVIEA